MLIVTALFGIVLAKNHILEQFIVYGLKKNGYSFNSKLVISLKDKPVILLHKVSSESETG